MGTFDDNITYKTVFNFRRMNLVHVVLRKCINLMLLLVLQWKFVRGPMAERKEARAGRWDARPLAVPRRVDAGLQGPLWRSPEHHQQRQIRGHLGQRPPGRIRLWNLRRRRSVSTTPTIAKLLELRRKYVDMATHAALTMNRCKRMRYYFYKKLGIFETFVFSQ